MDNQATKKLPEEFVPLWLFPRQRGEDLGCCKKEGGKFIENGNRKRKGEFPTIPTVGFCLAAIGSG
jgi:hypothetical protein